MNEIQKNKSSKKIKSFIKGLDSITQVFLLALRSLDFDDDKSYNSYLKSLYDDLQKICLRYRNFVSDEIMDVSELKQFFDREIENSEIEISKLDNNVIKISMPIITPFVAYKKKKLYPTSVTNAKEINIINRSEIMIDMLERAVMQFIEKNKIDRSVYQKKTLFYINYFENSYQRRLVPDTDNYSYKAFTDIITGYFTSSGDSAFNTDFILKTTHGDKTHTEIYLVPAHFNSFINNCISPNAIYDKSA